MQQQVLGHLREHGASTVPEIAEATGLPRSTVRMRIALAGDDIVSDGYAVALAPAPVEPCSMRASGIHPAFRRAAGGAMVCSACGRVKA
jgi:DNA-binding Lrp family transcriptional regulator